MPDSKSPSQSGSKSKSDTTTLEGALEAGYFGHSPKSIPNSEFSLKTGPDSPNAAAQIVDARRAQLDQAAASLTNDDQKKS